MCGCGQGINIRSAKKREKNAYLKDLGRFCPFCRSEDIVGSAIEVDGGKAFQPMSCAECGRNWQDIYTLTDMQETDTEI